ncbi:hypothetical protein ACQR3P_29050 [Rhodococcus sp. IEGM1300]
MPNPLLDLSVFPEARIDTMTLKVESERSNGKILMNRATDHFIMTYKHEEGDHHMHLKIKGVFDRSGMGVLLPAPVACFLYKPGETKPFKFGTFYTQRPSELLEGDEGPLYLEACAAAWQYIERHSNLKRGDLL